MRRWIVQKQDGKSFWIGYKLYRKACLDICKLKVVWLFHPDRWNEKDFEKELDWIESQNEASRS